VAVAIWLRFHPPARGGGWPPPLGDSSSAAILRFVHLEHESERFSQDLDWIPRVVLLAKTVYVWLDQLSKQYGRAITRLDQIRNRAANSREDCPMSRSCASATNSKDIADIQDATDEPAKEW